MSRPEHLPDFARPPLEEMVLGVQFSPVPGYSAVDAKDVWQLFMAEFPGVEEQPPLSPQFETFGGNPQAALQVQFSQMPPATRLWFISEDGSHLLQFQPDRFLINWRRQDGQNPYPRYEAIAEKFERYLNALQDFALRLKAHRLEINQAEATYVNIIPVSQFTDLAHWLSLGLPPVDIEAMNVQMSEAIKDSEGKPIARLHHDVQSVVAIDGKNRAIRLGMTYRGKPADLGIVGAMRFLASGREAIVNRFAEMTTSEAHSEWGRL